MLKPGTYRLPGDIPNPRPDRRLKRDWRAFPVWEAGWEFLVESYGVARNAPDPDGPAASTYTVIRLVGHRWSHENLGPGNEEQYAALTAALVPCPESLKAMFTRLDVNDYFAKWFVESGKVSREEFEKLWYEYEHQDDDHPSVRAIAITIEKTRTGWLVYDDGDLFDVTFHVASESATVDQIARHDRYIASDPTATVQMRTTP